MRPQHRKNAESTARRNTHTAANRANSTNTKPDSPVSETRKQDKSGNSRAKAEPRRAQLHQHIRIKPTIRKIPTRGGANPYENPSSQIATCTHSKPTKITYITPQTIPDTHKKSARQTMAIKYTQQQDNFTTTPNNVEASTPNTYKNAHKKRTQHEISIKQAQQRQKHNHTQTKNINIIRNSNPIYTQTISQQSTSATVKLRNSTAFPQNIPIKQDAGKLGLMWPRGTVANSHPAANMLHAYSTNGCPVEAGENWTEHMIITALTRGPHISAKNPKAAQYLFKETKEKIQGGFITTTKWGDIKHDYPKNLKLSPLAMIPHKSRSFRCILDLSFQLKVNGNKINSVNQGTKSLSPQKSMSQLGWVIRRMVTLMASHYNLEQPFLFSKCDIKDGFWRLSVNPKDAWNFCYALPPKTPNQSLDEIEIVIPHALQMGWSESPPFFCAATETARDIIQTYYQTFPNIPHHPLESFLYDCRLTQDKIPTSTVTDIEVYVDDFITCTNNNQIEHIKHLARAILFGIHSIFPPPKVSGHAGEDPVSMKKLLQKEGLFEHTKEILGWDFNGITYTIQLPKAKVQTIQQDIADIIRKKIVPSKLMEKIQGKLVHASFGIPGGRGLLSPLYSTKFQNSDFTTITKQLKQCLQDWKQLIALVNQRPTSVLELVPDTPNFIGYTDSSKTAIGGVWTNGNKSLPHQWVWRLEWPQVIQDKFISSSNLNGTISINDLEMAGLLMGWLVLEQIIPESIQGAHIGLFCDNMSTVAWTQKHSTATSTIAGHLLRALALRQHINKTSPLSTVHIEGIANKMADAASRSFTDKKFTDSNTSFLQTFNNIFPLQNTSWQEFHIPKKLASRVISCLLGKPLAMASWVKITRPEKNIGSTGLHTPNNSTQTDFWKPALHKNKSSSSQRLLQGSGVATSAKEVLSELQQCHKHSQPFPRPLNWLENAPRSSKQKKLTKHQWHGNWKATKEKIHLQHHNLRSHWKYQKNV